MKKILKTVDAFQQGFLSKKETIGRLAYDAADLDVDEMMKIVPKELHQPLKEFVDKYKSGEMILIGGAKEVPLESLLKLRDYFEIE